jgi:hypothetical protein
VYDYKSAIIREWQREGRFGDAGVDWLSYVFDAYFFMAMRAGFNGAASAAAAGVVFQDAGGFSDVAGDIVRSPEVQEKAERFLRDDSFFFGPDGSDIWLGYSHGGSIVFRALEIVGNSGSYERLPIGTILIEPRIGTRKFLTAIVLAHTRVTVWADPDDSWFTLAFGLHGSIQGAFKFERDSCGGLQHCNHRDAQSMMVDIARLPTNPSYSTHLRMINLAGQVGATAACSPAPCY